MNSKLKYKNKTICITGGNGFLGSHLIPKLRDYGYKSIFIPKEKDYDLTKKKSIIKMYWNSLPKIVIHLAGKVGGISDNKNKPGEFFYDNAMMGIQLMELGRQFGVEKFITIGSACVYPDKISVPFKEKDLWNGYPTESTAPYGLAKRMLLVQSQAYRKQYDFNAIFLILTNLYGENDKSSHVIPMLIKKCLNAIRENKKEITIWGNGQTTRDFLYAEDATEAIILAMENYNKPEPLNVGSDREITIKDTIKLIIKLTGFKGKIVWDASKPMGQLRRCLDVSKIYKELGFRTKTSLEKGLKKTIKYYE